MWSSQLGKKPVGVELLGTKIVLIRDNGVAYALRDRCPHRGVPLSLGKQEFPGTISCPYHGWTYDLADGQLRAVITDGPDSPICGKVSVETYPAAERLGMVWVFIGDSEDARRPIDVAIPKELREHKFSMGGRIDIRRGGWRYAAENGFDEGHAKYLHRTSLWRFFKVMPTWSKTRVIPTDEGWITRVQDEVHWDATFPGYGRWTNERWWRRGSKMLGSSPSKAPNADPTIASLDVAGNQHIRLPGLLRIVHTRFIHYEWYVPIDDDRYRYVQLFVQFKSGAGAALFRLKYLGAVRWLFHGQFTGQDRWMVGRHGLPTRTAVPAGRVGHPLAHAVRTRARRRPGNPRRRGDAMTVEQPTIERAYIEHPRRIASTTWRPAPVSPVLLLHQTPRSSDEFRDVIPMLAETHRVYAMDSLGFGDSEKPDHPMRIETCGEAVIAFADTIAARHVLARRSPHRRDHRDARSRVGTPNGSRSSSLSGTTCPDGEGRNRDWPSIDCRRGVRRRFAPRRAVQQARALLPARPPRPARPAVARLA